MQLRAKLLSADGVIAYSDWLDIEARESAGKYDARMLFGTIKLPHGISLPDTPESISLPEELKHLEHIFAGRHHSYLLRDDRGMEVIIELVCCGSIARFRGSIRKPHSI